MDPARESAVEWTEFYLASMWTLLPAGIDQVVKGMRELSLLNADYTYDHEMKSVKVICDVIHVQEIRQQFQLLVDDLEPEEIVAKDGTIMESLKSDLISILLSSPKAPLAQASADSPTKSYELPRFFDKHEYRARWTGLETAKNAPTFRELLPNFAEFAAENRVEISHDLAGRVVYIGSDSQELVDATFTKLGVILHLHLSATYHRRHREHLLYTEGYVEKKAAEYFAETRYMVNIDKRLAETTVLDTLRTNRCSYDKVYQQGVSIRLCPYDSRKGFHLSVLGLIAKKGFDSKMQPLSSDRPVPHAKEKSLETLPKEPEPDKDSQIRPWIESLQDPVPSTAPIISNGLFDADDLVPLSPVPTSQLSRIDIGSHLPNLRHGAIPVENKPIVHYQSIRDDEQSQPERSVTRTLINADPCDDVRSHSELAPITTPETIKERLDRLDSQRLHLLLSDSSVRLDDTRLLALDQEIADLAALPQTAISASGAALASNLGTSLSMFMPPLEPEVLHNTMRQQAGLGRKIAAATGGAVVHSAKSFNQELEEAQKNMCSMAEYRRGVVQIRADFGRIILSGMDLTALAFNDADSASDGWRKSELMVRLNAQFTREQHIHFTRIMTTSISDMNNVIALHGDNSRALWEGSASRRCIIYSLYCICDQENFIVDIKDHTIGNFGYTIREPNNDGHSVWVHGLRHDWDVRFTLSHVDTALMERKYGQAARMLLESLEVGRTQDTEFGFGTSRNSTVKVSNARVLTQWRYLSHDRETALDITEVREMGIESVLPLPAELEGWRYFRARPWDHAMTQRMAAQGRAACWYEMSILSTKAETLLVQNETLSLGEKAPYSFDDLMSLGVLRDLSNRALLVLRKIGPVGYANDNGQLSTQRLPQPNNPPGSSAAGPQRPMRSPATGQGPRRPQYQQVFW
ncbi:hypothetical protein GQ53DRAFT_829129 [Thozetella sp. PMI_491]|nr:hypothetical protein GQ53DRAFT_829129 [Thozetella sp. PMI_491]